MITKPGEQGVTPTDFVPEADEEQSLGRVDRRFNNVYAKNVICDSLSAASGAGSITVSEEDGNPTVASVFSVVFDEDDGFIVTDLGGGAVKINYTYSGFAVREEDLNPSLTGITTLEFDEDDGFIITNPSAGVAKINYTPVAGSGITVEDIDSSPTVASVTTLRFDAADGLTVSSPGAGIARVDQDLTVTGVARTYGNYGPVCTITTPPDMTGGSWAWLNQGSSTLAWNNNTNFFSWQNNAATIIRGKEVAAPAGAYTWTSGSIVFARPGSNSTHGIYLRRASTGRLMTLMINGATTFQYFINKYTNATTWSSTPATLTFSALAPNLPVFFKYVTDTTNHTFYVSWDYMANWYQLFTETVTTWFTTGAPDLIGYGTDALNATSNPHGFDTIFHWSAA